MTEPVHPTDATPRDTGRLRQANDIERFPMPNDRKSNMSPLAAIGAFALLLAVILGFAFGVVAFFKFVM